jgi:hypothetical protein
VSDPLTPDLLEPFTRLDACPVSDAIETLGVRLRNEGFTDSRIRCLSEDLPPAPGV